MEPGDWDDEAESSDESDAGGESYAAAPMPPHEREWRHPSELGAAKWAASEPPLVLGRGLSVVTGTIGVLLAAGLLWAMLPSAGGRPTAVQTSGSRPIPNSFSTTATTSVRPAVTVAPTTTLVGQPEPASTAAISVPVPTVVMSAERAGSAGLTAVAFMSESGPLLLTTDAAVGSARSVDVALHTGEVVSAQVVMVDRLAHIAVLSLPSPEIGEWDPSTAGPARNGDAVTVLASRPVTATLAVEASGVSVRVDAALVSEGALVVNDGGRLVGLCTRSAGGVALVSADELAKAARKVHELALVAPWLGVEFGDAGGATLVAFGGEPAGNGLEVLRVLEGSPAERAGLLAGDRVLRIDGVNIGAVADVVGVLARHKVGDVLTVEVERQQGPSAQQPPAAATEPPPATGSTTTTIPPTIPPTTSVPNAQTPVGTGDTAASTTTTAPTTTTTTVAPTTTAPPTVSPTTALQQRGRLSVQVTLAARPPAL